MALGQRKPSNFEDRSAGFLGRAEGLAGNTLEQKSLELEV